MARDSHTANQRTAHEKARAIYCCTDLSALCSKSDVLTPQGCRKQYETNEATNAQCRHEEFTVSGEHCTVHTSCKDWFAPVRWRETATFTRHILDFHKIRVCQDGTMTDQKRCDCYRVEGQRNVCVGAGGTW